MKLNLQILKSMMNRLNLTRSSIKDKLFEIPKEFKDLNFKGIRIYYK